MTIFERFLVTPVTQNQNYILFQFGKEFCEQITDHIHAEIARLNRNESERSDVEDYYSQGQTSRRTWNVHCGIARRNNGKCIPLYEKK